MTSSSSGVSKEFNQSTLGGRRRHRHWNRQRDRRTRVRQNCLVHKHNRWRRASTHVRYLSRCRSRRLAKSSRSGRLGGGSDHLRSTGHDAHLHLHSEVIRRKSKKGAVKRDRVARIGHGRNGDQADVADAAAGWIEINPASAGQVDLRPRVSRPARRAARRFLRVVEGDCEIPRGEPCGETK